MRKQGAWIRCGRRQFDLRLPGGFGLHRLGTQPPAHAQESEEKYSKNADNQFSRGVALGRERGCRRNSRRLRHRRLEAVRWGLVGHSFLFILYAKDKEGTIPGETSFFLSR